jgi:Rrf2 family iron-sulfur cluster assembly transcriptional regulator
LISRLRDSIVQLTTRGRYAVTAMLDLATNAAGAPLRLSDIADRQNISLSYLEQLFARLRRDELVIGVRGPGGGYRLGRGVNAISVADIIESVNERIDVTRCGGAGDCDRGDTCLTHHLWSELSEDLQRFLQRITLADLIARGQGSDRAATGPRLRTEAIEEAEHV